MYLSFYWPSTKVRGHKSRYSTKTLIHTKIYSLDAFVLLLMIDEKQKEWNLVACYKFK